MVSVLMTSYNREKYISESIESVLRQDHEDFEFIIVDDASEDTTWDIIQEYANHDNRIRAFKNANNLGDYPNRNIAANYATRSYIKYLDSDDILYPGALTHMVSVMESNPTIPLGLIGIGLGLGKFETTLLSPIEAFRQVYFSGKIIGCGPSYSIIRKEEFHKLGGFSPNRHLSDLDLWLKFLSSNAVCLFDESLVYWRKHDDQEFAIGEKTNFHLFNSYHIYLRALENETCPLSLEDRRLAIRNLKNRYSRKILLNLLLGKISFSNELFKSTQLTISDLFKSLSKNKYPIDLLRYGI
jgi:glycosyltransferase involved in cell wall biosynthesis